MSGLWVVLWQTSGLENRPLGAHIRNMKRERYEARALALQLPFMQVSESMGNHDSKIVDAASVD